MGIHLSTQYAFYRRVDFKEAHVCCKIIKNTKFVCEVFDSNFDRSVKSTATVGLVFYRGRFVAKSLGRNDQATAILCDRYGRFSLSILIS